MQWAFEDEAVNNNIKQPPAARWSFEDEGVEPVQTVAAQEQQPSEQETISPNGYVFEDEPKVINVKERTIPEKVDIPFSAKHPNLYALGMTPIGTAKELSKVSWFKYVYPEERKKLAELSQQTTEGGSNLGTRQLLFDTLEAVTMGMWKPLTQGAKQALKSNLPKTYKLLFDTPIKIGGKKATTITQKIATHKATNKGAPPPKKEIESWLEKAKVEPAPQLEKPLPKYAQSVNLEKQNIPLEAKKLELDMAGTKKTQSWDKTGKLSDDILKDAKKTDDALKKVKGLAGLTENIEVVRKANINQISKLAKMSEDVKAGIITDDDFNVAFNSIKENFFKVTSEGSSEIGRALNAHKKVLSETDHLTKGLAKIEKGLSSKQIIEFADIVKGGNPAKMARFTAELKDPKIKDYVLEYWYNSILSGPPTHAVNMISNSLWAAYQVPHRAHTALWDKLYSTVTGKERTRLVREVIPMLAGYKTGVKRGAKAGLETLKTGAVQNFETKWAQEVGLSSVGSWERSPHKWMRKLSPAVSAFTRALRAEDVFMNAIAYDGEMLSIATREGVLKGLKGEPLKQFIKTFTKNPSDAAHKQSLKFAKHSTFMDDPDKFTDWFLGVRKTPVIGPASQFVVPFVNTMCSWSGR